MADNNLLNVLGVTPEKVEKYAGWLKVEGIVFIVLGVLAIILPGGFTLALEQFLGWLFLIGGVFSIVGAVQTAKSPGFFLRLASAVVTAIAGGLLIARPMQGVLVLTIILAVFYLIDGIFKIAYALRASGTAGSGMALINGILGLVIAGIVYAQWPLSAGWFLGLIIGINLLMGGMFLLTLSSGLDKGDGPGGAAPA
ncbi:MAG: HdeD family acid-resistance protein [Verrucomicrobiota bacterium]